MSPEIQNALNAFSNDEWQEIMKRTFLYAQKRIVKTKPGGIRTSKGVLASSRPKDELETMATDKVHEAIAKVWLGERRTWKPQAPIVESFVNYLMGVIDSLLSNEDRSLDNTLCTSMRLFEKNDEHQEEKETPFEIADHLPTPDKQFFSRKAYEELKNAFTEDSIEFKILELAEEGITQRNELAVLIGCRDCDITNAKKRMKRRVEQFF